MNFYLSLKTSLFYTNPSIHEEQYTQKKKKKRGAEAFRTFSLMDEMFGNFGLYPIQ